MKQWYKTRKKDPFYLKAKKNDIISDNTYTKSSESLVLEEHWGHIHFSNMSTNTHHLRGSVVSAVVYLSVPKGCGSIVFWPNPLDDYRYIIPPKKGMFLLFPGWIPHSVSRNLSSEPRVSLSFNFKLNSGEA